MTSATHKESKHSDESLDAVAPLPVTASGQTPQKPPALEAKANAQAQAQPPAATAKPIDIGAAPLVPEPSSHDRLAAIQAAKNPLLEAAKPLLRALADMPEALDPGEVTLFRRVLEREVSTFGKLCATAQISFEHIGTASYSLCTALDEAANGTAWGGGKGDDTGVWAPKQLAAKFHGDIQGGDKFFLMIGYLCDEHHLHIDLLEVMYMILGLGFEGRFRKASNGKRELDNIRNQLYTLLGTARGDVPSELSPHWRGVGAGRFRLLRTVPVWVTVAVLSLALFAQFAWYKYQLLAMSATVVQQIGAIGQLRRPLQPPIKPLRLKELLAAEIDRGTVSVDEDARHSAVSFKGDDMFVPGQARLSARIDPVLTKVADEIKQVGGTVQVTGHSDNQPIRTREFPDNQVLSEKRAAAVAEVLQARGVSAARLQVGGKGDTAPVADNATAAGRSRNRRVDVVVTQGAASISPSSAP